MSNYSDKIFKFLTLLGDYEYSNIKMPLDGYCIYSDAYKKNFDEKAFSFFPLLSFKNNYECINHIKNTKKAISKDQNFFYNVNSYVMFLLYNPIHNEEKESYLKQNGAFLKESVIEVVLSVTKNGDLGHRDIYPFEDNNYNADIFEVGHHIFSAGELLRNKDNILFGNNRSGTFNSSFYNESIEDSILDFEKYILEKIRYEFFDVFSLDYHTNLEKLIEEFQNILIKNEKLKSVENISFEYGNGKFKEKGNYLLCNNKNTNKDSKNICSNNRCLKKHIAYEQLLKKF